MAARPAEDEDVRMNGLNERERSPIGEGHREIISAGLVDKGATHLKSKVHRQLRSGPVRLQNIYKTISTIQLIPKTPLQV